MNKICWKGRAFKALSYGKNPKKGGRNFSGSITIFHRGGGSKKLLRRIDFQRKNVARGLIERIEYDPNRTARIALVRWSTIEFNGDDLYTARTARLRSTLKTPIGNRAGLQGRLCDSWSNGPQAKKAFSYILACDNLKSGDEIFNIEARTGSAETSAPFGPNGPTGDLKVANFRQLGQRADEGTLGPKGAPGGPSLLARQREGNSLLLANVPLGSLIHNIELNPGGGGKIARSAGTSAQLVQKSLLPPMDRTGATLRSFADLKVANKYEVHPFGPLGQTGESPKVLSGSPLSSAQLAKVSFVGPPIGPTGEGRVMDERPSALADLNHKARQQEGPTFKASATASQWRDDATALGREARAIGTSWCSIRLPSGSVIILDSHCRATIGIVSNTDHGARNNTKAGQSRWLGRRPVVRGVAMNPIDHPHGGGEGRTKGGRPSVSPWGKPAKGGTTRRALSTKKKASSTIVRGPLGRKEAR